MPFLKHLLTGFGLGYVVTCIALWLIQDSLLFQPNRGDTHVNVPYDEYVLPVARNGKINSRGYVVNEESEGSVIVFFTSADRDARSYVKGLYGLGFPVVISNYRGFGESDGSPSEKTMISDAKQLIGWVRTEYPDRPLLLMGYSIGSAVATLACDEEVDGLILVAPFRSLVHVGNRTPARFFPLQLVLRTKLDVRSQLDSLPEKILVLYSSNDNVIPPEETKRLLMSLPQAQVVEELHPHEQLLSYKLTYDKVMEWINSQFEMQSNDAE